MAQGAELSHVEGAVPGGASTQGRAALGQTRKPRNNPHTSESVPCGRQSRKSLQISQTVQGQLKYPSGASKIRSLSLTSNQKKFQMDEMYFFLFLRSFFSV